MVGFSSVTKCHKVSHLRMPYYPPKIKYPYLGNVCGVMQILATLGCRGVPDASYSVIYFY